MQISYFVVEDLGNPELRPPGERPPGTYSFVVCIPPTPSDLLGIVCCPVVMNIEMGVLGTPEGRAQILGEPQWPWMAVQLTSRQETSCAVINAKWSLLWNGIRLNIRLGSLSLDPEFVEPPSFGLSEIVYIHPQQMARWYAALQSIVFWYPMLRPNPSECHFSKCLLFLQMEGERRSSPGNDAPDNDSKPTTPLSPHAPTAAEAL
jgi:hypothetical protein